MSEREYIKGILLCDLDSLESLNCFYGNELKFFDKIYEYYSLMKDNKEFIKFIEPVIRRYSVLEGCSMIKKYYDNMSFGDCVNCSEVGGLIIRKCGHSSCKSCFINDPEYCIVCSI